MNPVPNDNPINGTSGCANVISSTCISWQGGDIECITICNGDTLTDVVANMGAFICSALGLTTYDPTGLAGEAPTTYEELIQLMIDNIVNNASVIAAFECDCEDYVLPLLKTL